MRYSHQRHPRRPFGFSLRRPPAAVSSIYHFRVGRWVLMGTPGERPPEPHGTLLGGKLGELQLESMILWIPGSAFLLVFLRRPSRADSPIYHFRVGFWALMATAEERPPGTHRNPRVATER